MVIGYTKWSFHLDYTKPARIFCTGYTKWNGAFYLVTHLTYFFSLLPDSLSAFFDSFIAFKPSVHLSHSNHIDLVVGLVCFVSVGGMMSPTCIQAWAGPRFSNLIESSCMLIIYNMLNISSTCTVITDVCEWEKQSRGVVIHCINSG